MIGIETVAALIGIITFVGGLIAWYRGAVQKEYASQRDWEHVKNNQKQLVENLNFIFKEIERNFDEIKEQQEESFDKIIEYQDNRFDKLDSQVLETKGLFYALLGSRRFQGDKENHP